MAKTFRLEIITPDRVFFSGEVEHVIVTTTHGEMGLLAGAMPLVATLADGTLKIHQNNKWMNAVSGEGFLEVNPTGVILLTESAEWPYELREKAAAGDADEVDLISRQLKKQQSLKEYKMAKAQLARQLARLQIKKNMGE